MDIFVKTVVTEDDVCITCAAGDYERDELSTLVDEVRFGSCLIDQECRAGRLYRLRLHGRPHGRARLYSAASLVCS